MTSPFILERVDEAALSALAVHLAPATRGGGVVHLRGELGAGKTTFARALLQGLGVEGRIKSPTYSLIESYRVGELAIHHLDLYRIAAASELECLGVADLWDAGSLVLIEWPERGAAVLPPPDLALGLEHDADRRRVRGEATGPRGAQMLEALARVAG